MFLGYVSLETLDLSLDAEENPDHDSRDYSENWWQDENCCESGDDSDVEGPSLDSVNVTLYLADD
jgi:hypothetical protein